MPEPTTQPQPSATGPVTDNDFADCYEGRYFSASNWPYGNRQCVITEVGKEEMTQTRSGSKQKKVTLRLDNLPKHVVLNVTNFKRLSKKWGNRAMDWVGGKVFVAVVDQVAFGEPTKGFTISPV